MQYSGRPTQQLGPACEHPVRACEAGCFASYQPTVYPAYHGRLEPNPTEFDISTDR